MKPRHRFGIPTACLFTAMAFAAPIFAQASDKRPGPQPPEMMRVVPIRHGEADEIASLLNSLSHSLRSAWDSSSNSIVLAGSEKEIADAVDVIAKLDVERRAPQKDDTPKSMRVTIFYVEGNYDAEEPSNGSALPKAIEPAARVLTENGVHNLSLLTTKVFNTASRKSFGSEGSVEYLEGDLQIHTKGELTSLSPGDAVELRCQCEIKTTYKRGDRYVTQLNFDFGTTLIAPLGEFVIVGASPIHVQGQKVLAIIIRVEKDHPTS